MTEEEAKTKWCPYARIGVATKHRWYGRWIVWSGLNRFTKDKAARKECNCIASDCALWKESEDNGNFGQCGLIR